MRPRLALALATAFAVACVAALAFGPVPLSPLDVWHALTGSGSSGATAIVWQLRLPRAALGAFVGAGLGMSGAALQATLRNPLAEPYLLGVSGGAAVGAVAATVLGAAAAFVPPAAFVGAALAVGLVLAVARVSRTPHDARILIMAGVVVGAFANAAIMIVLAGAPAESVRGALWWMMGSLADASWSGVAWVAVYVAAGGAALLALGRDIELLSLGEDPAAALGVDVARSTRNTFLAASLVAAVTVAGAGLVGFVGLIVPAIVRALG
ncbi:MAG: iron ABC transporter permease, partial [Gemmatimonadetes bacterium]|nr:iron ABC transporter permease [Gemmatimonadota bacterium]